VSLDRPTFPTNIAKLSDLLGRKGTLPPRISGKIGKIRKICELRRSVDLKGEILIVAKINQEWRGPSPSALVTCDYVVDTIHEGGVV
jgi:hypothetical protein